MRFFLSFVTRRRACSAAVASLCALGAAGLGIQAQAATDAGTATARVVRPITIADNLTLRFGSFSTPPAGGATVTISTAGSRSFGNGALGVTSTVGQATFDVAGEGSLVYTITLPSSVNITTDDGGSADEIIAVSSFTSDPATTGTLSGTLGGAGTQTLNVGATLTTAANQVPGVYTGTFNVTVEYQ